MNLGSQSTLKLAQLNAENLFLYMDKYEGQDLTKLTENQWQQLSYASVSNKPLYKVRWLARSIFQMDPDILCLSEVGGLESLINFNHHFLNNQYEPHLIEGNSDRGIDVGYLVHKRLEKKYHLVSHKNRPINFLYPHEKLWNERVKDSEPEKILRSHYFSRDVSELRIFGKDNQLELILLACHLKSKWDRDGVDPSGKDRRQAELQALVDIYKEVKKETRDQTPIIVAGDFNGQAAGPECDEEFRPLLETDLKDALELCSIEAKDRITQLQIQNGNPPEGCQIDFVFLSHHLHNAVVKEQCEVYRYRNELGLPLPPILTSQQKFTLPSDHFPVVVTLAKTTS